MRLDPLQAARGGGVDVGVGVGKVALADGLAEGRCARCQLARQRDQPHAQGTVVARRQLGQAQAGTVGRQEGAQCRGGAGFTRQLAELRAQAMQRSGKSASVRVVLQQQVGQGQQILRSVCTPVMAASCSVRRCSAGKAWDSRGALAAPGAMEPWKLSPMRRTRPHCSGDKRSRSAPATRISDCKTALMPPSR